MPRSSDAHAPHVGALRRVCQHGAMLLILPGAAVACGSSAATVSSSQGSVAAVSATSPTPAATTTPQIGLNEWTVVSPTTYKAGQVSFNIVNQGGIEHELLVFKSDLDPSQYPQDSNGIIEDGAGITKISDGDNVGPGQSQLRTIDLSHPGKYLFVCNIPAHFKHGMFTVVTVSP